MSGVLPGLVPGQLCLLGRLDELTPLDAVWVEVEVVVHVRALEVLRTSQDHAAAGLGERDRAVLALAARCHASRRRDERVHTEPGFSPTRYVQLLAALLDRPEAANTRSATAVGGG